MCVYNPDFKELFLQNYKNNTAEFYRKIFMKTSTVEESYGKDVYLFNVDEYSDLLLSFESKSLSAISSRNSILKKYIDFAIEKKQVPHGQNIAALFDRMMLQKFVSNIATERKLITKEELMDIINTLYNAQDQALVMAYWVGIMGTMSEEVINLTIHDIDRNNNTLTLTKSDNTKRIITVDDFTIDLLEDAYLQEIYTINNGDYYDVKKQKNAVRYLVPSDYIFKNTSLKFGAQLSYAGVYNRFKSISKWYGNRFLTPSNVRTSGMLHMVNEMIGEDGSVDDLTDEQLEMIAKRYEYVNIGSVKDAIRRNK
jgi:integrase